MEYFFPSSPRLSILDSRTRSRLPEWPCYFQSILSFQKKNAESLVGNCRSCVCWCLVTSEAVWIPSFPPAAGAPFRYLIYLLLLFFFLSLSEMLFNDNLWRKMSRPLHRTRFHPQMETGSHLTPQDTVWTLESWHGFLISERRTLFPLFQAAVFTTLTKSDV